MIIENRNLRRKFSASGCCEHCHVWQSIRHCAHLFHSGIGGGSRLDVRINMLSLCWLCHGKHHNGHEPSFKTLIGLIAKREGTTPDAIRDEIFRLRRLPKETTREQAGHPVHQHSGPPEVAVLPGDPLEGGDFGVAADEDQR